MGKITTSLVISFADPNSLGGRNYVLTAELDSRPDGYNKGITSFIIGDSPAYLIFKSPDVTFTQTTTSGSVSSLGEAVIDVVDSVTFAKTNTASLSKPAASGVTWLHVGGDVAELTVKDATVTASVPILAVYQATYKASALVYRLSGVSAVAGVANVQVIVFIEGITPA